MSILEKAQIGDSVQVNLELSKDRLNREIIDTINMSPLGTISDFKITDGKGIGVILKLSNGTEQWFFENEINILDAKGDVIEKIIEEKENNFIINLIKDLKYEDKNKTIDLINPFNFVVWLVVSFKDNF